MANYGQAIDKKWQNVWEESGAFKFKADENKKKLYVLEMFSYPSGSKLHAGHWFNYGPTDSWARMKKLQGYNVFQPMGFDAVGHPRRGVGARRLSGRQPGERDVDGHAGAQHAHDAPDQGHDRQRALEELLLLIAHGNPRSRLRSRSVRRL